MEIKRKRSRRILLILLLTFCLMNVVAYFHASKFTHFDLSAGNRTKSQDLSFPEKLQTLFFGVSNPKPVNAQKPEMPFETLKLKSNTEIECWFIKADTSKGTVILFHGYGSEKSSMLDKAELFLQLGFNTLLVDFRGCGGSEGLQTTIGFYEAEEVKTAVDYLISTGEKNIILFGTSMGAAAVMKAQSEYQLPVHSLIIECPFGTLLKTAQARFSNLGFPSFPMANLLVFWGGFQNEFNGFELRPVDYAKSIECSVLLMYGEKDEKVSRAETDEIFQNLNGKKQLKLYPLAGHENYLNKYRNEWTADVTAFIGE